MCINAFGLLVIRGPKDSASILSPLSICMQKKHPPNTLDYIIKMHVFRRVSAVMRCSLFSWIVALFTTVLSIYLSSIAIASHLVAAAALCSIALDPNPSGALCWRLIWSCCRSRLFSISFGIIFASSTSDYGISSTRLQLHSDHSFLPLCTRSPPHSLSRTPFFALRSLFGHKHLSL